MHAQGAGSDPRQSPVDLAGLMQQLVHMQAQQVLSGTRSVGLFLPR